MTRRWVIPGVCVPGRSTGPCWHAGGRRPAGGPPPAAGPGDSAQPSAQSRSTPEWRSSGTRPARDSMRMARASSTSTTTASSGSRPSTKLTRQSWHAVGALELAVVAADADRGHRSSRAAPSVRLAGRCHRGPASRRGVTAAAPQEGEPPASAAAVASSSSDLDGPAVPAPPAAHLDHRLGQYLLVLDRQLSAHAVVVERLGAAVGDDVEAREVATGRAAVPVRARAHGPTLPLSPDALVGPWSPSANTLVLSIPVWRSAPRRVGLGGSASPVGCAAGPPCTDPTPAPRALRREVTPGRTAIPALDLTTSAWGRSGRPAVRRVLRGGGRGDDRRLARDISTDRDRRGQVPRRRVPGRVPDPWSTRDVRVPPLISLLTGITDDMVLGAPPVSSVLPSLLEFVSGSVIVGHNVGFDLSFLDVALEADGYEARSATPPSTPWRWRADSYDPMSPTASSAPSPPPCAWSISRRIEPSTTCGPLLICCIG